MTERRVEEDPRFKAFMSPNGPDVFFSVVPATEIWKSDPFDVDIIHQDARATFHDLLGKAAAGPIPGRLLLIRGEAGAGKTHMMRYFHYYTHSNHLGYFGYLTMTSPTDDYGHYILSHLIDSLNQPYDFNDETTGLMRLSNVIAESPATMQKTLKWGHRRDKLITALREWEDLDAKVLAKLIETAIRGIVTEERFKDISIQVLSAFLYLQVNDSLKKNLVMQFLRNQEVTPFFLKEVPLLASGKQKLTATRMIAEIARLMWMTQNQALVICADQLEDLIYLPDSRRRVVQALHALSDIASSVPSSLVVISCLEDFYTQINDLLTLPIRDRLNASPSPCFLKATLDSMDALKQLVGNRLSYLYETCGAEYRPEEPFFPIPETLIGPYRAAKARKVLQFCGQFRTEAIRAGRLPSDGPPPSEDSAAAMEHLEREWLKFLDAFLAPPFENEEEMVRVLAEGLKHSGVETQVNGAVKFKVSGGQLWVNYGKDPLLIGICDARSSFGHLMQQVQRLEQAAKGRRLVMVRSTEFPKNPKTQISGYIGELIAKGARRAVMEDSEWRAIRAFPLFREKYGAEPFFIEWQQKFRPLARYPGIQKILDIDEISRLPRQGHPNGAVVEKPPEDVPVMVAVVHKEAPAPKMPEDLGDENRLLVGKALDGSGEAVYLPPSELTRHAAFLGSTGSGKSTTAMNLLEQLLLQGIPVILVDRKGDLAGYADPAAWRYPHKIPGLAERRRRLKEQVEVHLFTPGHPKGRRLAVSVVPDGTSQLPAYERELTAAYAASAMAVLMGFKSTRKEQACQAILKNAIFLLTEINDPVGITLQEIIDLVSEKDARLVNRIGKLDTRLFDHLTQSLEVLRLTHESLLKGEGARLSADLLLGLGDHKTGKTRLSIISTKFLRDHLNLDFFMAQLLLELGRWISRHPAGHLQAAIMFDEADIYLPAVGKPAAKAPMENLLKRARAGGLGIFLATQSPGDMDYKCRENILSWFLGRIKEPTALAKLRPLLAAGGKGDDALAAQSTGQFLMVREGQIRPVMSHPAAIRLNQLSEEKILALSVSNGTVLKK